MLAHLKIQKTKSTFFLLKILFLGGPSPPSQLVPNPFNWSPKTVFYRYFSIGHSNQKKLKKTKYISFQILLLGGLYPPSQLVPNPFNWSPNTFFTDRSVKRIFQKCIFQKCIYLLKVYLCEMYSTCVSSKLCEFIISLKVGFHRGIFFEISTEAM